MEDEHTSLVPLSPSSSALFASFTTLYDDNPLSAVDLDASALELDAGNYTNLVNLADGSESQQIGESQSNSPPPPNAEHYYTTKPSQRMTRTAAFKEQKFPCYMCFSLVTGEPTKPPKRSALSLEGREQAKRVRRMGACLRCQLRKIKVSYTTFLAEILILTLRSVLGRILARNVSVLPKHVPTQGRWSGWNVYVLLLMM